MKKNNLDNVKLVIVAIVRLENKMDILFKRISATIMRTCFNLDYNSRVITVHDQATNDFKSN